jgi:glycine/D-amino acid oxidase-like deaminating enzyme
VVIHECELLIVQDGFLFLDLCLMKSTGNATKARDLRTGLPVWLAEERPPSPEHQLTHDLVVDVAVIGGGVSGALVADAMVQAGQTVAVFDRRGLVKGSTPASTALLQFEIDQPLTVLSAKIGEASAARAYWRSAAAIGLLRGRVADLKLRCGFRERNTVYLPGNVLTLAGLRREAEARMRIGLRSQFIGPDALVRLTTIEKPGAIWSGGAAEVDPVRLVRGLWRSVIARGGSTYFPVEIVDIDPGRLAVTLTTDTGVNVRAKSVILATGYELSRMLRPKGYKVISTWVMATAPQKANLWPSRCLIWEAADPYLYIRTTADDRVVVGGEDAAFSDEERRDQLLPAKIRRLQTKLGALLPRIDTEAEFAWTGSFGESVTGLPAIGPVPGAKGCYAVMGFGGNGITFSVIAAQMLQRAVLGLPDPDSDLFALG